jgi:hypothetical protein
MAHVNFHLAVGIGAGTLASAIPVARAWLAGRPVARPIAVMIVASYALALWAIVPNVLTELGVAGESVHTGGWANVFVGHAAIDRRVEGGLLLGEVAIAAAFIFHYAVVIAAIVRAKRRRSDRRAAPAKVAREAE